MATPKAAAVESRLASTPIAAISGAWKAISNSRKPSARMTPIASGVFAVSADSRSWFSAAGPPRRAAGGRSWRRRSIVTPVSVVEGPLARHSLDQNQAGGAPSRRGDRNDARVGREGGCGGGGLGCRCRHLQGPRRAGSEGGADLAIADPRGIALRHDLDRGHARLQAGQRQCQADQHDQGEATVEEWPAPESLAPGGEAGGAMLAAVGPGERQPVDPRPEFGQHGRQQGQRRGEHEDHRDHDSQRDRAEGRARHQHHRRERDQDGQGRRRGPPCRRCPSSRLLPRRALAAGRRERRGSA